MDATTVLALACGVLFVLAALLWLRTDILNKRLLELCEYLTSGSEETQHDLWRRLSRYVAENPTYRN